MGENSAVRVNFQPSVPKPESSLPLPRSCPMRLYRSQTTGRREKWYAICLLALVFSLFPAASADNPPRQACSGTSLPKGCTECRSAGDPTSTSIEGGGDALQNPRGLPVYPLYYNVSTGPGVSPCGEGPPVGGPHASDTKAVPGGSLRLLYPPEGEQQLMGRGSLIDGRYLLVELLHPRPWELRRAASPEKGAFGGLDGPTLQRQAQPQLPAPVASTRSCCDEGVGVQTTAPSGTIGLWPSSGARSSTRPRFSSHPLLLPPGLPTAGAAPTGAALAAAVVSVRSKLVVARQRGAGAEGFCIDPFM